MVLADADVRTVTNAAARKALTTDLGDIVLESSTGDVYKHVSGSGSSDGDWVKVGDLDPVNVSYTPATSGNWSPAPTTVHGALDQLAARVKALE